ncbi:repeat protein [Moumouvirus goulette]|uniref:Repeat protein n=1 Tax=Moumouvirus goulette TaxID=1247379 RepID=M1PM74_9VIRU|nr:repeat protein [Moumouvirus goulette]AGF85031.1 repeat protein [Moumouvirus goulette]
MFFKVVTQNEIVTVNKNNVLKYLPSCLYIIPFTINQNKITKYGAYDIKHINTHIYLLNNGVNYKLTGYHIIKWVCMNGLIDILDFMIRNGVDINYKNGCAIRYCAKYNRYRMVKLLIKKGADITLKNNYALMHSCFFGYYETTKILVDTYINQNISNRLTHILSSGIIFASRNGHVDIVKYLCLNGGRYDYEMCYALRKACNYGHINIVKYLLGLIGLVNSYLSAYGATKNGHLDILKLLYNHGTNLRDKNDELLTIASEFGHLEIVKYLISLGCDINAHNSWSLRYASCKGHFNIVKYLIENGADISSNNNEALRWASFNGNYDIIIYLLEKGADKSSNNYQAHEWAIRNGYLKLARLLDK